MLSSPSRQDHRAAAGPHLRRLCLTGLHIFFVTALLTLALFAQSNTGSIVGHVADPVGRPVAGASVVVENTDLSSTRTTLSDAHGDFRVAGLVPGALTVQAKAPGLASRRPVRVTLGLGSTVHVELALRVPAVSRRAETVAD